MLFCNSCGQSKFISDDHFISYEHISGTETRYLNCETGDIDDYGDMNTDSDGESETECPYCSSSDIDWDKEDCEESGEEALELRNLYDNNRRQMRADMCKLEITKKIKDSEWDLATNEVHN